MQLTLVFKIKKQNFIFYQPKDYTIKILNLLLKD